MPQRTFRPHPLSHFPAWLVLACTPEPSAGVGSSTTGSTGTTEPTEIPLTDPTGPGDVPSTGSTTDASTSSTSSSSSSSGTTGPTPMCGDGVVDPDQGEACDLGADNQDDGPCTVDCKAAVCGDGLVWSGIEACDDAADNGNHYGGCSDSCEKNPYCGDSVVDVQFEDCDLGASNGTGEGEGYQAPCSIGCTWDGRIAFLTSVLYDGNLGGLEGADELCRYHAWAAGMQRWDTVQAWLSADPFSPLNRFVPIPVRPILLPNGELVADSLSDLIVNGPGEGIRVDEFGTPLPPSKVWTNTGITGEPYSPVDDCGDWSSTAPGLSARVGYSHVPHEPEEEWEQWQAQKQWTSRQGWDCYDLARLYCFEQ
jgi:hypothetical protein